MCTGHALTATQDTKQTRSEQRRTAVYRSMIKYERVAPGVCATPPARLLEDGADSMAQLLTLAAPFSESELHEVRPVNISSLPLYIIDNRLQRNGSSPACADTRCAASHHPSANVRHKSVCTLWTHHHTPSTAIRDRFEFDPAAGDLVERPPDFFSYCTPTCRTAMHRLTSKLGSTDDALRRFQLQHTQHSILRMGSLEDERVGDAATAHALDAATSDARSSDTAAPRTVRFAADDAAVSHGPAPRVARAPHLLGEVHERTPSGNAVESGMAAMTLHADSEDDDSEDQGSEEGSVGLDEEHASVDPSSDDDDDALQRASELLAYWQRQVRLLTNMCLLHHHAAQGGGAGVALDLSPFGQLYNLLSALGTDKSRAWVGAATPGGAPPKVGDESHELRRRVVCKLVLEQAPLLLRGFEVREGVACWKATTTSSGRIAQGGGGSAPAVAAGHHAVFAACAGSQGARCRCKGCMSAWQQAAEWQLLTLVLLKALSLHRVPALQEHLDGRTGLMHLQHEACRLGSSVEEVAELLAAVCEE